MFRSHRSEASNTIHSRAFDRQRNYNTSHVNNPLVLSLRLMIWYLPFSHFFFFSFLEFSYSFSPWCTLFSLSIIHPFVLRFASPIGFFRRSFRFFYLTRALIIAFPNSLTTKVVFFFPGAQSYRKSWLPQNYFWLSPRITVTDTD